MNDTRNLEVLSFIRRLTTAVATVTLYDLQHQQVSYLCRLALEHLQQIFTDQEEVSLLLVEGELIF